MSSHRIKLQNIQSQHPKLLISPSYQIFMGFFDFLRRSKKEEIIQEPEKLHYKDIDKYVQDKKVELKKEDEEFLDKIKTINNELIFSLEEKIEFINNLDLNEKKAEEKIKTIIKGNLDNYMNEVEKLKVDLGNLSEIGTSKDLIDKINVLFLNFQKKSEINFQKATYLVGELGQIKEKISLYFKNLDNLVSENKSFIDRSNLLDFVSDKLRKISETEKTEEEIKTEIEAYKNKIDELNKEIEDYENDINKIKKSDDYKEEINKKEKIKSLKRDSEKEINSLRDLVNLKVLSNIFHQNEKEMSIIKEYKVNFLKAFQKDDGKDFGEIISSTSQIDNKDVINKKFELISDLKSEIGKLEDISNTSILNIDSKNLEIKNLKDKIDHINKDIERENKRYEKMKMVKVDLVDSLKNKFKEANVDLING